MIVLAQPQYKIEQLNLLAQQAVEGYIIGLHKSPFHGFSIEFSEHRLYNNGDSLRHIDWKVYGKSDKLFIKKYEEETNLRCCIGIDISSSMYFPETGMNKLQGAGIATACILQILKKQLDAAALCFFDDEIKDLTPFKSSSHHYDILINNLENKINHPLQINHKTNLSHSLHELATRLHRKSLVILFSDFFVGDDAETQKVFDALQHLKFEKHEVLLFHIIDFKKEINFDLEHEHVELVNLETEEIIKLETSSIKENYQKRVHEKLNNFKENCIKQQISYEIVDINVPIPQVLTKYLQKRIKLM